jgi:hypothetical protein
VLSFYTLLVLVSLTGGAFLPDLPLDLRGRGIDPGCTKTNPSRTPGGNCGK